LTGNRRRDLPPAVLDRYAEAMPSGPEWIIVLVVVLVIFGGSQLPKLAKNLGKAQKEFKDGLAEGQADKAAEKPERDVEAELAAARAEAAELRAQAAARAETPPPTTAAPATPPSPTESKTD
jgi:sec-independent protein translocase protein TatA